MSDDVETPAQPRASRFREHTNTTNSIRPPPDELWKDIQIDDMIEKFNEENNAPPKRKGSQKSSTPSDFEGSTLSGPPATPAHEGTFGRFSRAFASVLGSVLGKRKAGNSDAEKDKERQLLDERKAAAEQAYEARKLAQEMGLMPTPKVFVRPTATPRSHKCVAEHIGPAATPRTPSLYKSPSKKDLQKQMKLSKRVSDLEVKLASARKELRNVLHQDVPPLPPLPAFQIPTPTPNTSQQRQSPQIFSDRDISPDTQASTPAPSQSPNTTTTTTTTREKIIKKRRVVSDSDDPTKDPTYKPLPTDSEPDLSSLSASEPEPVKAPTKKKVKRQPSRLQKSRSKSSLKEEKIVTVVPDGKRVPEVPAIPHGVEGNKVKVPNRDDGYGGFGHEIF